MYKNCVQLVEEQQENPVQTFPHSSQFPALPHSASHISATFPHILLSQLTTNAQLVHRHFGQLARVESSVIRSFHTSYYYYY